GNDDGTCGAVNRGCEALDSGMLGTHRAIPPLLWIRLREAGGFVLHDIVGEVEMHGSRAAFHSQVQGTPHRTLGAVVSDGKAPFGDGPEELFLIDALTRQMTIQLVRIAIGKHQHGGAFEQRMCYTIDRVGGAWTNTSGTHSWTPL